MILAIIIVAGSFYSFWQKQSENEVVSSSEALAKGASISEEKASEFVVYISGAVSNPIERSSTAHSPPV